MQIANHLRRKVQGYGFFGSEAQQIQVGALYKDLTGNSLNIGGNPTVNYDGSFTFQFQAPPAKGVGTYVLNAYVNGRVVASQWLYVTA